MLSSLENFTQAVRAFNPLKQKKSMSMLRKIENYLLRKIEMMDYLINNNGGIVLQY